jgi:hypothetical protein
MKRRIQDVRQRAGRRLVEKFPGDAIRDIEKLVEDNAARIR